MDVPERDRLCIFAAAALASAAVSFGAAILAFCFEVLICAEEDMEMYMYTVAPRDPMVRVQPWPGTRQGFGRTIEAMTGFL